jgi:putative endonuclease
MPARPDSARCDICHRQTFPISSSCSPLLYVTQFAIRAFDRLALLMGAAPKLPPHIQTGRRGEEAAYFYLRRRGYVMVARNFRSPHRRGEIDLIGWHQEVLCFIEVKTRTTRDVKPAEAAVDHAKLHQLALVAREYMRLLPGPCSWRFDVVSVYYDHSSKQPAFELFQNVSSIA